MPEANVTNSALQPGPAPGAGETTIDLAKVRYDADAYAAEQTRIWVAAHPNTTAGEQEAQQAADLKQYGAGNPAAREAAWSRANPKASAGSLEDYRSAALTDPFGKTEVNIVKPFLFTRQSGEVVPVRAGRQFLDEEMASHWFVQHHTDDPPPALFQPGTPDYADQQRRIIARRQLLEAAVAQQAHEAGLEGARKAQPAREAAETEAAEKEPLTAVDTMPKARPVGRKVTA